MKNIFLKVLVSLLSCLTIIFVCSAVLAAHPMDGDEFKFRQPDGTKVLVKVYGDEYYQRVESLDGYTLIRNAKGHICYAKLDSNGNLVPTSEIYTGTLLNQEKAKSLGIQKKLFEDKKIVLKHVKEKHQELDLSAPVDLLAASPTPIPTTTPQPSGVPIISTATPSKVYGIVILIDFPDVKSTVTQDLIDQAINKPGIGSVYDHFYDISGQKLEFTNKLIGFYTAKYNKNHYDSGTGYAGSTELLKETCDWLNSTKFDTTGLSLNPDKSIMAVTLLYAGTADAGWANGLWPHSGGYNYTLSNGVRINSHQFSSIGSKPQPSAMTHECEHMILKWPDYYDYDDDSKVIGNFNNFENPHARCVISRFYTIKWLNGLPDGSVVSVPAGSRDVFGYINTKNNNEMFIVENIRKTGDWSKFPGEGLVVWHIDKKGNNNYQDMTASKHYITSVEQADGKFDMEKNVNSGDTGDFFRAGYKDKFNDVTLPNSKWWDGSSSGFNISNISAIGNNMTFVFSSIVDGTPLTSATPTLTQTPTPTRAPTYTPTPTPTRIPTYTATPTPTPTRIPTYTPTPTSTSTPTPKPTSTPTPTPTQPLVYKIEGYIAPDFNISLDSSTVKSGYKIEIMGTSLSAISDKNGYFVISNIPSGVYSVRISKQGYLSRIISNVIANNNVTIGTSSTPVLIWAGDIPINGAQDDIINMNDIIQLAQVFNTTLSSSNYLPQCDLNCDNTINIADVVIIAAHFNSITSNYPEFVPIYSK